MGLWDDAQKDATELNARAEQARRSAEDSARRGQAARDSAAARHAVLIAEFIDGMRRLGKAPDKCAVYQWSSGAEDMVEVGSVEGWVIARYWGFRSEGYYIVVTPDGAVLDTRNQVRGKKPIFGKAPILRSPMSLPIPTSYPLGEPKLKHSYEYREGEPAYTVPARLDLEAALKAALTSAMRT